MSKRKREEEEEEEEEKHVFKHFAILVNCEMEISAA